MRARSKSGELSFLNIVCVTGELEIEKETKFQSSITIISHDRVIF